MKVVVFIVLVLGRGLLFLVSGNIFCAKFVLIRGMSNDIFDLMLCQLNEDTSFLNILILYAL